MPSRWRRGTAGPGSGWSSRPSRGSGGSDREVARQRELAQMEGGVPDALPQGVTGGDLVRRARAPERLRRHEPPVELRGSERGKRRADLTRELLYGGDEGDGVGAGDGKLRRPVALDLPAAPEPERVHARPPQHLAGDRGEAG